MATVTQQDLTTLHKQLNVTISKNDYLPQFEKALKEYGKKANIPGFRKGMVPAGLIKKMYGSSLFTDEVLRTVDKEVFSYIDNQKLEIFAQPLPVSMNLGELDVNNPTDYTFTFEVGMKPDFQLPDLTSQQLKYFKVEATDDMVNEEVEKLRTRYGNMTEPETVNSEENFLNVTFTETDEAGNVDPAGLKKDNSVLVKYFKDDFRQKLMNAKSGDSLQLKFDDAFEGSHKEALLQDLGIDSSTNRHFRMDITKIGQVESRELNEEFFNQLFPEGDVKTEEDFRNKIRTELEKQWEAESKNQLHHQVYHLLLEKTHIEFPADFLKRWMKSQGENEQPKTDEEVEKEFPDFLKQLKWTLITEQLVKDNQIEVLQDDIRQFAKQQLLGYMGMGALDEEQEWVRNYIDKMMKDKKYVEDAYIRLQTQRIFEWAASKVQTVDTTVSKEEFIAMNAEHKHAHHE